ncbi:MAG: STAS domain-containing protein [Candidatus Sulfotelmatobacter sp.]
MVRIIGASPRKCLIWLVLRPGANGHTLAVNSFELILVIVCHRNSRHCAKEEPIPLLDHNSMRVDKPEINIVASENGDLVSLKDSIDIDSSPAVRDRLLALLHAPHPRTVSIDLSAVTHIDSSGVATFIEALKIARNCETELRLQGLHDRLHRLFEATGILSLFNGGIER